MSNTVDDAIKSIDQAIEEIDGVLNEDPKVNTSDIEKEDSDDPEESRLHNPQLTPPAVHDGQAASGSTPDLESDDDIDKLGHEYGPEYAEDEELNVEKKVAIATDQTPPTPDSPKG